MGAFLALCLACIFVLPSVIVAHDRNPLVVPPLTQAEILQAKNDVRQTLLQGLGGLAVLSGAALGVWLTLRQVQVSQEGQITDRFSRAVDQLGSPAVDVRVGGVYALERIARDSVGDRGPVIEVLTAFVRNHSPWPLPAPEPDKDARTRQPLPRMWHRASDVQAAMIVLGRSGWWRGSVPMELGSVDLRRSFLAGADLGGAYLAHANLRGVYLEGASLEGAKLRGARLDDAHLGFVDFRGASLPDCQLQRADLHGANLERARLTNANLEGALLSNTHLEGADLTGARFVGAVATPRATWPAGFDPASAGVTIVERLDQKPEQWGGTD